MSSNLALRIDPQSLAALELFPLTLLSDSLRDTPDLVLAGEIAYGQSYGYAFKLSEGFDYRFVTSGADDGFAERALLLDRTSGEIVWGNAAALTALGVSEAVAAQVAATPIRVDDDASRVLVISGAPDPSGDLSGVTRPFVLEARADVPVYTSNAVFRFVNSVTGKYFYTISEAERDVVLAEYPEYRLEGTVFTADDEAREGWTAVYRFGDTRAGGHLYTASEEERDIILEQYPEYRYEGVGFYVPPPADDGSTTPVFRLSNVNTGAYLFTTDPVEKLFMLLKGGWLDQGVVFHALVPQSDAPSDEPSATESAAERGTDASAQATDAQAADPQQVAIETKALSADAAAWLAFGHAPTNEAGAAIAYDAPADASVSVAVVSGDLAAMTDVALVGLASGLSGDLSFGA